TQYASNLTKEEGITGLASAGEYDSVIAGKDNKEVISRVVVGAGGVVESKASGYYRHGGEGEEAWVQGGIIEAEEGNLIFIDREIDGKTQYVFNVDKTNGIEKSAAGKYEIEIAGTGIIQELVVGENGEFKGVTIPDGQNTRLKIGNKEVDVTTETDESGITRLVGEFGEIEFEGAYNGTEIEYGINEIVFDSNTGQFVIKATAELDKDESLNGIEIDPRISKGKAEKDEQKPEKETLYEFEVTINGDNMDVTYTGGKEGTGKLNVSFSLNDAQDGEIGNMQFDKFLGGTELTVTAGSIMGLGEREYKLKSDNIDAVAVVNGTALFTENTVKFLEKDTTMAEFQNMLGDKDSMKSGRIEIDEKIDITYADGTVKTGTRKQTISVEEETLEINMSAGAGAMPSAPMEFTGKNVFKVETTVTIDGEELEDGHMKIGTGESLNFNGRVVEVDKTWYKSAWDGAGDAAQGVGAWINKGLSAPLALLESAMGIDGFGTEALEYWGKAQKKSKTGKVLDSVSRGAVDLAVGLVGVAANLAGWLTYDTDMQNWGAKVYQKTKTGQFMEELREDIVDNLSGSATVAASIPMTAGQTVWDWISDDYEMDEDSAGFQMMTAGLELITGEEYSSMQEVSDADLTEGLLWTAFNIATLMWGAAGKTITSTLGQAFSKFTPAVSNILKGIAGSGYRLPLINNMIPRVANGTLKAGNILGRGLTSQAGKATTNALGKLGKVEAVRVGAGTYLDLIVFDESYEGIGDWADKKTYEVFSSLADGEFSEALLGALNWALDDLMVASGLRILGKSS
ncbi:MAG: hypothetical protein GY861_04480, partial [bacterium]|nr:hypothetical protein [bacterium]